MNRGRIRTGIYLPSTGSHPAIGPRRFMAAISIPYHARASRCGPDVRDGCAMIKIEIDDREVRAALEFLSRRVSDMTPAMHRKYQAFGACRSELGMSSMPWNWLIMT